MKRLFILTLSLTLGTLPSISAQSNMANYAPLSKLTSSERKQLQDQALDIFSALKKPIENASKSTVTIGSPSKRLAFGIAVKSPFHENTLILTKWSEVANYRSRLFITTPTNQQITAHVSGVYPEHDLALLSIADSDTHLQPINLNDNPKIQLGDFITLARHDGRAEGFGVISVKSRNLQESSKGYLGVQMRFQETEGKGVLLEGVLKNSAADLAGLREGDELTAIDNNKLSGSSQMRNLLQKLSPGSRVSIKFMRQGKPQQTTVIMGSRADDKRLQKISTERMVHMERMGATPNYVRSNFPNVIQSDMPIEPHDVGSAAVNLDGEFIGLAIARASRIKTYIIPASTIREALNTKPLSVEQALYGNR
ncbi:PDZ domain-containing protein [Akkermansiaceae bacterium]|nr:PDZ domain-containing protein [Akkermansiaceae bacterium]